jgi:hypothetical protein
MNTALIDDDVLEVLRGSSRVDNRVYLPAGQLERKLYERTNEVLTRLGGKWKSGKVKAHVFEDDDAASLLAEVLATGIMPPKNPLAFFESPEALVAERMIWPIPHTAKRFLEPSAGNGAIVRVLLREFPLAQIDAVELDPKRVTRLKKTFPTVRVAEVDFLTMTSTWQYDAILMNPPFATERDRLEYLSHIIRAFTFLEPGGRLMSIAPAGLKYNTDKRTTALRTFIDEQSGTIADLPRDTFKESGTLVGTVLVYLQKSY